MNICCLGICCRLLHQEIFPNASVMHPPKFSVYTEFSIVLTFIKHISYYIYIYHMIDAGITPRNLPASPAKHYNQPAADGKADKSDQSVCEVPVDSV